MRRAGVRGYRDCIVAGTVLCGHVLLVLLFARAREHERSAEDNVHRSTIQIESEVRFPTRAAEVEPDDRPVISAVCRIMRSKSREFCV